MYYSFVPATVSTIMKQYNSAVQPSRLHATSKHNDLGDVTVTKQYAIHGELRKELTDLE